MNRFLRRVLLVIIFAVLSFSISCTQTKNPTQVPSDKTTPRAAGPQEVTQIDDAKIKELLKPNGKPLLVNFWATWCGPCREEFPDLVKIDAEYRDKIDFITVSLDFVEDKDAVPSFLKEMNAEMPTYLLVSADENSLVSSISQEWSGALPFTILYRQTGEVAFLQQGKVNPATLKSEIEKTLETNQ